MSRLHDVIHELIDLASGKVATLAPDQAAELHEAVDADAADAAGQSVDGPDVAPEPVSVADQLAAGVHPDDTVTKADQATGTPAPVSVPAEPARII